MASWPNGSLPCSLPSLSGARTDGSSGNPSYTPVDARRTLARPEAAQPATQPVKIHWPPSVREYVGRAFAVERTPPGIDKAQIAAKLKDIITEAAENGSLESIDWEKYPLPVELIQQERAAVVRSISSGKNGGNNDNHRAKLVNMSSASAKKRKSSDVEMAESSSTPIIPPWNLKPANGNLADRMSYPDKATDKRQKKTDQFRADFAPSKLTDLEKRRQRFNLGDSAGGPSPYLSSPRDKSPLPDATKGPVVGTCQVLEKNYFRLTAEPKPETVRPLPVLQKALQMIIKDWCSRHNYGYICDQFKSLRQDLTVQHIKNEFTVKVYEAHARIALEKGDMGEYNQCQTQLRALYKQKLGGCPGEFTAYRILYFIYTANRSGMNDVLAGLTTQDKQHAAIKHALDTRAALATANFHRFFKMFNTAPNMGAYLMDMFVDRERLAALAVLCKA